MEGQRRSANHTQRTGAGVRGPATGARAPVLVRVGHCLLRHSPPPKLINVSPAPDAISIVIIAPFSQPSKKTSGSASSPLHHPAPLSPFFASDQIPVDILGCWLAVNCWPSHLSFLYNTLPAISSFSRSRKLATGPVNCGELGRLQQLVRHPAQHTCARPVNNATCSCKHPANRRAIARTLCLLEASSPVSPIPATSSSSCDIRRPSPPRPANSLCH